MKKKLVALIIFLILIISLILYLAFSLSAIKKYISKDMKTDFPDKFIDYQIVNCNFGINNIEYAFVGEYNDRIDNLKIFFYRMKRDSLFTTNNWSDEYLGGTTIKNTTFPELVKMVKEDCSQFQKGYLDYTGYEHLSEQEKKERYWEIDQKNLGWTYTPYTSEPPKPPEPELTEEEERHKEELEDEIKKKVLENRRNAKPIEDLFK